MARKTFAFFFCTGSGRGIRRNWMRLLASILHLLRKLSDAHHRPAYRTAADFLDIVARRHAQSVEASVERFQRCYGLDMCADTARRTVLDVDRSSHRDLVAFTVGLERMEGRGLH